MWVFGGPLFTSNYGSLEAKKKRKQFYSFQQSSGYMKLNLYMQCHITTKLNEQTRATCFNMAKIQTHDAGEKNHIAQSTFDIKHSA